METVLVRAEASSGDKDAFSHWDGEFHLMIAQASSNPLLITVYRQINQVRIHAQWDAMSEKILTPDVIVDYNRQHRGIFDALTERDAIVDSAREVARFDSIGPIELKGIAEPIQVFRGANGLTIGDEPGDDAFVGAHVQLTGGVHTECVYLSKLAEILRPVALLGELPADVLERSDPLGAPIAVEVCAGQLGDGRASIDVPTGDGTSLVVAIGEDRRRVVGEIAVLRWKQRVPSTSDQPRLNPPSAMGRTLISSWSAWPTSAM